MNWRIEGDFSTPDRYDNEQYRWVNYLLINQQQPIIHSITLTDTDGHFKVAIQYKKDANLQPIFEALDKVGLGWLTPEKSVIILSTSDKQAIGLLLRSQVLVQDDVKDLIPIFSSNLGIAFNDNYTLPIWMIAGTFENTSDETEITNQISYFNTQKDSLVSEIHLIKYANKSFQIIVSCNDHDGFITLKGTLIRQKLLRTDPYGDDKAFKTLRLCTSYKQSNLAFLQSLAQHQKNIGDVIELISNKLGFKLDFLAKSQAFREQFHAKHNIPGDIVLKKMLSFLPLKDQCKLKQLCKTAADKNVAQATSGYRRGFLLN